MASKSTSDSVKETLGFIDSLFQSLKLDNLKNGGAWDSLDQGSLGIEEGSTINFLTELLKRFVDKEMFQAWLVKLIMYELPLIELGVKGVLLSQIKQTIDCTNDPRIPNSLRQSINGENGGMIVPLYAIDVYNMLSISPFNTKEGSKWYFGVSRGYRIWNTKKQTYKKAEDGKKDATYETYADALRGCTSINDKPERIEGADNVYELCRAKDFNAFIWFAMNKAKFRVSHYCEEDDIRKYTIPLYDDKTNDKVKLTNLKHFKAKYRTKGSNDVKPFSVGDVFYQKNSTVVSLCVKETKTEIPYPTEKNSNVWKNTLNYLNTAFNVTKNSQEQNPTEKYTVTKNYDYMWDFAPVSNNNNSVNWYVQSNQFLSNMSEFEISGITKERDYDKEYGICNLKNKGGKLRFSILPKPFIHKTPSLLPLIVTFDKNGEQASPYNGGRFTVRVGSDFQQVNDKGHGYYELLKNNSGEQITDESPKLYIDNDKYTYKLDDSAKAKLHEVLYECYPKLTIYEFNYDLVMGMRFFDPVTIVTRLLTMASNMNADGSLRIGVSKTETMYQMRIAEFIQKMIEKETTTSISDCFFSFDNDQYAQMEHEAELKRANLYAFQDETDKATHVDFSDVYDILNEYNATPTNGDKEEVLTRAFTTASARITAEVLPEDKYSLEFNFLINIIKLLVNVLVEVLFSPKVMLVLLVNRKLMGDGTKYDYREILRTMLNIITTIVGELIDMIIKELWDFLKRKLLELIEKLAIALAKEQIDYYMRLIKQLVKTCTFKIKGRQSLDSVLDGVDYADIDDVLDSPQTEEC